MQTSVRFLPSDGVRVAALPAARGAPGLSDRRNEQLQGCPPWLLAPSTWLLSVGKASRAFSVQLPLPPHPNDVRDHIVRPRVPPQLRIFVSGGVSGLLLTRHHLHQKFHVKLLIQPVSRSLLVAPKMSKVKPISPDSTGQGDREPCGWPFKHQVYQASPRSKCLIAQPGPELDAPVGKYSQSCSLAARALGLFNPREEPTFLQNVAQETVMGVKEGQNVGCHDHNGKQVQGWASRSGRGAGEQERWWSLDRTSWTVRAPHYPSPAASKIPQ